VGASVATGDNGAINMKNQFQGFPSRARRQGQTQRVADDCEALFQVEKRIKSSWTKHVEAMSTLQQLHFASNRYALLLIFQGMDAAGKDGAVRHVLSGVNPAGCQVWSFKQPSAEELEHDFFGARRASFPTRANRHLQSFLL